MKRILSITLGKLPTRVWATSHVLQLLEKVCSVHFFSEQYPYSDFFLHLKVDKDIAIYLDFSTLADTPTPEVLKGFVSVVLNTLGKKVEVKQCAFLDDEECSSQIVESFAQEGYIAAKIGGLDKHRGVFFRLHDPSLVYLVGKIHGGGQARNQYVFYSKGFKEKTLLTLYRRMMRLT